MVKSIEELRLFSEGIKKGFIQMPNITKLSKQLGKDRKTVRKALKGEIPKKTRKRKKYLDKYYDIIFDLLHDEHREFEYYQHLYNYLVREKHISCSYGTLKNYIKNNETLKNSMNSKKAHISFTQRFETEAGKQAQFDLKERVKVITTTNEIQKINIATMTLGYSRKNYRKIVPDTSYETVISFLAEAYEYFGGVCEELVIDNIKCLVDKPRTKDKAASLNVKFEEFLKDYDIEAKPCMPYRPETKGKTETQNKVPGQIKNYNGTYADIYEANEILAIINKEDNEKISQGTGFPPDFLFEQEKTLLKPLPPTKLRQNYYLKLKEVYVSNESMITYKSNKYSLPKEFIGDKVGRIIKKDKLLIYYNTNLICIHQVSNKKFNIKESHNLFYEKTENLECKKIVENIISNELMEINYANI